MQRRTMFAPVYGCRNGSCSPVAQRPVRMRAQVRRRVCEAASNPPPWAPAWLHRFDAERVRWSADRRYRRYDLVREGRHVYASARDGNCGRWPPQSVPSDWLWIGPAAVETCLDSAVHGSDSSGALCDVPVLFWTQQPARVGWQSVFCVFPGRPRVITCTSPARLRPAEPLALLV